MLTIPTFVAIGLSAFLYSRTVLNQSSNLFCFFMILILGRNCVEARFDELVENTRNLIKTTSIEIEKWRQNGPLLHVKVHRTIQLPFFSPLGHTSLFSHLSLKWLDWMRWRCVLKRRQLGLGKMEIQRTQVEQQLSKDWESFFFFWGLFWDIWFCSAEKL